MEELLNIANEARELAQKRSSANKLHIAILYRGKCKIEHIGVNKYNATYKNPLHCLLTIHAEMDAINGLLRGYSPAKVAGFARQSLKIFVVRFTRTGRLANSEPCRDCLEKMRALGIKRVSWSTSERTIVTDTPINLLNREVSTTSSGNRKGILRRIANQEYTVAEDNVTINSL